MKNVEIKPKLPPKEYEGGIKVIEISGKNVSEPPKRIKRLDTDESDMSPDSQKLLFFPSRTLKPPRTRDKPKILHLPSIPPNHRASSRMSHPRPFKHMMAGSSKPHGFKIQTTARSFNQINNINDIINHNQFPGRQNQQLGMQNPFLGSQNQFSGMQNQFPGVHNQHSGVLNQFPVAQNQFPGAQNQFSANQHLLNGMKHQTASNQRPNFTPNYQNPQLSNIHHIPGQPTQFSMNQNNFPMQNNPVRKKQKHIQQFNNIETSSMHPIQLAGTYRHPRKEKDFTKIFNTEVQHSHYANQQAMQPDPFHNFKPNSASEINQMVTEEMRQQTQNSPYFRRKFKHQIASIPNYKINSKDVTGIYQNVLSSGKKFQDRNEMSKSKPIQLMLDVYPANNQEAEVQQQMPSIMQQMSGVLQNPVMQQAQNTMMQQYSRIPKLKPFQGYYQDPSYFNSMTFPQLMPRYPSYYRYPKLHAQSSNMNPMSVTKPSQLVVHLNLFPKDKTTFKRSSREEEVDRKKHESLSAMPLSNSSAATTGLPFNINFNVNTGNGHPENINHHVNLPKDPYQNKDLLFQPTLHPSYYYDENEENDQSIMVAPSLVYQNIQRDRPIQLMLKNATSSESTGRMQKTHKFQYQTIERPKKLQKIKNEPRNFYE